MRYPRSESYLATQKRNTPSGKISGTSISEIFPELTNETSTSNEQQHRAAGARKRG